MLADGALNPDVYGEGVQPVQAEEHGAVRDLVAHAAEGLEVCAGGVRVHPGGGVEVHLPRGDGPGGVNYVRRAVARVQRRELRLLQERHALRRGEGVSEPPGRLKWLAEELAELLHYGLYARYVVALGDDEGAERLPFVLAQDAYALARPGAVREVLAAHDALARGVVVRAHVEVVTPEADVGLLALYAGRPAESKHPRRASGGGAGIAPAPVRVPAEALPALEGLIRREQPLRAQLINPVHSITPFRGYYIRPTSARQGRC